MPDADVILTFIVAVFGTPILWVGALVGALGSIFFVYLALLDLLDPISNFAPTRRE